MVYLRKQGTWRSLCAQEPQRVLLGFLALSHHGNQTCTTVPGICPGLLWEFPTTPVSGSRSQGWAGSQPLHQEQRILRWLTLHVYLHPENYEVHSVSPSGTKSLPCVRWTQVCAFLVFLPPPLGPDGNLEHEGWFAPTWWAKGHPESQWTTCGVSVGQRGLWKRLALSPWME